MIVSQGERKILSSSQFWGNSSYRFPVGEDSSILCDLSVSFKATLHLETGLKLQEGRKRAGVGWSVA